jgi:Tol biopolymer transport system component
VVTGLSPGTVYVFKVEAGSEEGAWSVDGPQVTVRTRPTYDPSAPLIRASVSSAGSEVSTMSGSPGVSADGRFVTFSSPTANLVVGDTNDVDDVFLFDRGSGTTERLSVSTTGTQANGPSSVAPGGAISADGRYVVFSSDATNLVEADTNGRADVFVRDRIANTTVRVSETGDGSEVFGGDGIEGVISADGRFVAFSSDAADLVPTDPAGSRDVFLRDRDTDSDGVFDEPGAVSTVRCSESAPDYGVGGWTPALSGNGRYVAFVTTGIDSNEFADVYAYDRMAPGLTLISATMGGSAAGRCSCPSISSDGRYVGFVSSATNVALWDTNETVDVFVRDRDEDANGVFDEPLGVDTVMANLPMAVGAPTGDSPWGRISADGCYVIFCSDAPNIIENDTNGVRDVFVRDLVANSLRRLSSRPGDTQTTGASDFGDISSDGHYVVFASLDDALVEGDLNAVQDVFVTDIMGTTAPNWTAESGWGASSIRRTALDLTWPAASDDLRVTGYRIYRDGSLIASPGGGDLTYRVTGLEPSTTYTFRIEAVDGGGSESTDGPTVMATTLSAASLDAVLTRASVDSSGIEGGSNSYTIGASGRTTFDSSNRYVVFVSEASNLVPNDNYWYSDIFVYDRQSGETTRASVAIDGTDGNAGSGYSVISANGRYVAFSSSASNLVPDDTNAADDVFVRDMVSGETTRVSVADDGSESPVGAGTFCSISGDGQHVAFDSQSTTLVTGDSNGSNDVFVRHLDAGRTTRVSVNSGGAEGNDWSDGPDITPDGRFVVFTSWATNLVDGDTNGNQDVFRHDLLTGETIRVSVAGDGSQVLYGGASGAASTLRSSRTMTHWSQAIRTSRPTSSCATWARARRYVSVSTVSARRAMESPGAPRSAATGATWPSSRQRQTLSRATRTAGGTCSSMTWSRAKRPGPASARPAWRPTATATMPI